MKSIKNQSNSKVIKFSGITIGLLAMAAIQASAQITNGYDSASNPAYGGDFEGINGGFGFGSWTLSTPGGGHYVSSGFFGLWNNGYGAGTGSYANRLFDESLSVGQAFSTSFQNGHLNSSYEQGGFNLEDSSGNILFSFWQQGGNNADGNYSDANGAGTATGFAYDFGATDAYAFSLDSATSYTFTDLTTSAGFTGTLSGTIDQVQFFRQNLAGDSATGGGGGTDFRIASLGITSVPEPSTLGLAGLGGVGLIFFVIRRRQVRA